MRHYITFAPEDDSSWALSYDIMPTVSVIHGMDESPQDALGSFSEYGAVRSNEDIEAVLDVVDKRLLVETLGVSEELCRQCREIWRKLQSRRLPRH